MTKKADLWKYDVEVISSPQYYVVTHGGLQCDGQDRLWAQVEVNFVGWEWTDFYHARCMYVTLLSVDRGVTWQVADQPWPAGPPNRVTFPDGTIVELSGEGPSLYERHPRSEISRLREQGYHVHDLGPEADYCAIAYAIWLRRSTDGGKTWQEHPIHRQLPFMAYLVAAHYPLRLDDGVLLYWAYGFSKEDRDDTKGAMGGRRNAYALRSPDGGHKWDMIEMADGDRSPSPQGFTEIFPLHLGSSRLFATVRTALATPGFAVWSDDGGRTWSEPRETPIVAKHPIPARLADGTIVCAYQRRFAPPFGVRARFTSDLGQTWSDEVIIRDDIPVSDGLGMPCTVTFSDGTLFTLYNAKKRLDDGSYQSFVGGTRWSRDRQPLPNIQQKRQQIQDRGSWSPQFPLPPVQPRHSQDNAGKSRW